ncbi:MAG TPA: hypothetical protein VMF13_19235, partial [Luteitalea sp.]|nr:hypothetical protein [Luteitalea sp.]
VVVEGQVREDLVLVEQIVADRHLAEEIALPQGFLLAMPSQEMEELRLKSGAAATRAAVGSKRIFAVVEDEAGVEALTESFGEDGLTDTWRALDREVAGVQDGAQYTRGAPGCLRPAC